MSEPLSKDSPAEEQQPRSIRRFAVGMNSFIQILLAFLLVIAVNMIVSRYYTRYDLSRDRQFTLSQMTVDNLAKLTKKVEITAVLSERSGVHREVSALLDEYKLKSGDKVAVEWVDPAFQKDLAEQIKLKYDIPLPQESLIVHSEGHTRVVTAEELWYRDPTRVEENRVQAFVGEAAVTSAILSVVTDETPVVYVLAGMGGRSEPGGAVFAALSQLGKVLNIRVESLNLQQQTEFPADAGAVVLPGLKYDLSERQIAMLTRFFETPQRSLLVMLDPEAETPRVDEFLKTQGVLAGKDRVLYAETTASGVVKHLEVEGVFEAASELTKPFGSANTTLPGQTESVRSLWDDAAQQARQFKIETVLAGGKNYWGETNFLEASPKFDGEDVASPVSLALTVERGFTRDAALRVQSSRMLVVGNAALLDPATQTRANSDLISVSLNWMLNRNETIQIPPKYMQSYRIDMPTRKQTLLFWVTGILLPASMFLFGFFIWSTRRN